MTTAAVIPIKRFDGAKHRLAGALAPGARRALAAAMAADVLTAVRRAHRIDLAVVVTADREASALGTGHGAEVIPDPEEPGHNPAAALGVRWALERGAGHALLLPGDCPAMDPRELDVLVAGASRLGPEVVVVPDRHGTGTNGLLLTPPGAMAPSFGEGSRARHERDAKAAGAKVRVEEPRGLLLDVDTVDDLRVLRATLASTHGGAAHTRGLLARFDRT